MTEWQMNMAQCQQRTIDPDGASKSLAVLTSMLFAVFQ